MLPQQGLAQPPKIPLSIRTQDAGKEQKIDLKYLLVMEMFPQQLVVQRTPQTLRGIGGDQSIQAVVIHKGRDRSGVEIQRQDKQVLQGIILGCTHVQQEHADLEVRERT